MQIDLTDFELFKSFAQLELEGLLIDLHNEFDCQSLDFSESKKELKISFIPNSYCIKRVNGIEIIFEDCEIQHYPAKFQSHNFDLVTIDTMYRGRFEKSDGKLEEKSNKGYYYYLSFLDDVNIELFAGRVKANIDII